MEARLLLLALLPLAIGLPMENPRESFNFANGFPGNFAEGLPTDLSNGVSPVLSRSKRQLGVSQHIAEMLAAPYEGPQPSDITSLFERNSLVRPVRQSLSSDSQRKFPQAFTPSNTFFDNFVQEPVRPPVRKQVPQPTHHSVQRPFHQTVRKHEPQPIHQPVQHPARQPVRKHVPHPTHQSVQQTTRQPVRKHVPHPTHPSVQQTTRQSVRKHEPQSTHQIVQQDQRTPQRRPQQNVSPEFLFPTFSEAQAEHKRNNEENINHFINDDGFFESSRIRNRREVISQQAPKAEGREDNESHRGFMPNNFPSFQSIGGFDKMSDEPDQSSNSFVPDFIPPKIRIPDIEEEQPKFSIPDHFALQRLDTSEPLYREQLISRSRVAPWIFREQIFDDENNLQPLVSESRKRRRAGEPGPIDPSQIPHKRVPRVENIISKSSNDESQIPHVRVPRQHKESDQEKSPSELLMTKIPLTSISRSSHVPFESFPDFNFPTFESERLTDRLSHAKFIPKRFTSEFGSSLRNPSTSESDHILPESQRLYPTYNPRRHPFPPSSNKPFFPPAPRQPGPPGPRSHFNGHASTRGPSTRGPTFRPSHGPGTGPKGFRDFHDTFYGPDYAGGREAIHRPEFHFPSTPPHREHEYPNENSLLGSGNFEILRGGTFYEPGDYHLNHHPYDHLLDGGYSPFHSNSHSNNYVDDYFSNFRDFSEFAARSDSGEGDYHGFSEPITSIVDPNIDMDHTGEESSIKETHTKLHNKTNNSIEEPNSKNPDKDNTHRQPITSHRQPKNIQEVLEQIDPRPNNHSASELTVDEKDPMIAMY